jgi:hypothetical protein
MFYKSRPYVKFEQRESTFKTRYPAFHNSYLFIVITFIIETVYRFVNTVTKIGTFHQLHVLCNSNEELSTFVENSEYAIKKYENSIF